VIIIAVLGIVLTLVVVALRTMPRGGSPRLNFAISGLPLLLTLVVPMPLGLTSRSPTDWARQTALTLSRIGIALSFVLLVIGAVLTFRAAKTGDRRAARVLAIETALAGLPAGIISMTVILSLALGAMLRLL
jgi:hypothetical protein